jgi:N-methylhydantoinase A
MLGRLNPGYFLGGKMTLKTALAQKVLGGLGKELGMNEMDTAFAMVDVANENMANAIRLRTIQRGLDPRKFSLMAFGGAGPLHACSIARKLGIPLVIVPPHPGVFSALGLLLADLQVDKVWTKAYRSDMLNIDEINKGFSELRKLAVEELKEQGFPGEPTIHLSMSMRYLGQNYELQVDVPDQEISPDYLEGVYDLFHQKHKENYGYALRGEVIEVISFNATAVGPMEKPVYRLDAREQIGSPDETRPLYVSSGNKAEVPIYRRERLGPGFSAFGPAMVEEMDSTTFIDEGCTVEMDEFGILKIHLG